MYIHTQFNKYFLNTVFTLFTSELFKPLELRVRVELPTSNCTPITVIQDSRLMFAAIVIPNVAVPAELLLNWPVIDSFDAAAIESAAKMSILHYKLSIVSL